MSVSRRSLWIVLALLAALAATERWGFPGWVASRGPVGPARWISAPPPAEPGGGESGEDGEGDGQPAEPVATGFFAVRDFEVEEGFERAELKVTGDEEFWVNLNGQAVAAGRFHPEAPLIWSEVGSYLRPGLNRLVVELRAARPAGGVLLSLEIFGPSPSRIVSDRDWRIVTFHRRGLEEPGTELPDAVPARVWGAPPTGRWGWPRESGRQPALAELLLPAPAAPAVRARVGDPAGTWFRLPSRPDQADPLGNWVTFDFGEKQSGFLTLWFREPGPLKGLVYVGPSAPDPRAERPDAVLLKVSGLKAWTRVEPRRFRYVTVISTAKVVGAQVFPVAPQRARRMLESTPPPAGAFGMSLERLPLRTAVENEIWRDWQESRAAAATNSG